MNARKAAARDALPRLAYVLADVVVYVEADLADGKSSIRVLLLLLLFVCLTKLFVVASRYAHGTAAQAENEAQAAASLSRRVANFATRFVCCCLAF
jgi:hypothetical protein